MARKYSKSASKDVKRAMHKNPFEGAFLLEDR